MPNTTNISVKSFLARASAATSNVTSFFADSLIPETLKATPIGGDIEKGAFHKWLGKAEDEPITDADIEKGLAAGGHAAKMANFAKNARKWKHGSSFLSRASSVTTAKD